jgi:hypothetical protein
MSMHKVPLTELERSGLEKSGLSISTPSQLSDAFRSGVRHAAEVLRLNGVGGEAVGCVYISHYKGLENRDFDYWGSLPDGSHNLYAAPQPQQAEPGAVLDGWQPIETAPKDFVTEFDGWNGRRVPNVIWAHPEYAPKGEYDWCYSDYVQHHGWVMERVSGLTHWMPLPAAPKPKEPGA